MPTASDFRQYAQEAIGWADQSKSEQEREACIDLAQTWAQAAIQAEMTKPAETASLRRAPIRPALNASGQDRDLHLSFPASVPTVEPPSSRPRSSKNTI